MTSLTASAFTPEMKTMTLSDGEEITARLCLPDDNPVKTIVFCIHGTGPNTWLNKRDGFNYYDDVADGFCSNGIAFFSYNRRGVDIGETPPLYNKIDSVKYAKYLPVSEAQDVECMISALKKDSRFEDCKIILYGISEGTVIASMVADRKNVPVDAVFLHGYAHESMYDIIKWQNEGHGVMNMVNAAFDRDGNRKISREEYESDNKEAAGYKKYLFQNLSFETLDAVKDSVIDINDIRVMREPFNAALMEKIVAGDEEWIQKNYFYLTTDWFKQHFALEANKTRLLRLDIPIYIFHGTDDASVPVENVYDLQARFGVSGKNNLHAFVFEKHNHDLNFLYRHTGKKWSEGYQKIFQCAVEL
jgi:pimeloyl-ACP methyl ester carboxylesterase